MFCAYCGAKLSDDAVYCSNCGEKAKKVDLGKAMSPEKPVLETASACVSPENAEARCEPLHTANSYQPIKGTTPKKRSVIFGIAAVTVAVLVFAAVSLLGKNKPAPVVNNASNSIVSAEITSDGTAYVLVPGEAPIVIGGEVRQAVLSEDREHLIVLLDDGTLYVTDKAQSKRTTITDAAAFFEYTDIRNDGFFYSDIDNVVHRILFSDFSSVALGQFHYYVLAENTTSVIYCFENGDIYIMSSDAREGEKIGTFTRNVEFSAISDDGKISVWTAMNGDKETIYLHDGNEKIPLGEPYYSSSFVRTFFTKDHGLLVVVSAFRESMWIKRSGQSPIRVQFDATLDSSHVFTNDLYITDMLSEDITSLYIDTASASGRDVHCVSLDGQREKILTNVRDYRVCNGGVVYIDEHDNLYLATLSGALVSDQKQLASAVDGFEMSRGGEYVYFMKDCADNAGTLFCYKIGAEEPLKVAEDVFADANDYYVWMQLYPSVDGSTLFFYQDMGREPVVYEEIGTLMRWDYGDAEVERIASCVVKDSLTSAIKGGLDADRLLFAKFDSTDSDYNVFEDWMYYNGEETVEVASDTVRR